MSSPGILLLRADASEQIGTGHVMRCLALGQYWRECGGEAVLATHCRLKPLLELFWAEGAKVIEPKHPAAALEEAREICSTAQRMGASWIALDGYRFSADYQECLSRGEARLLVIDDNGQAGRYSADLVLDQNLPATEENYSARDAKTGLLLGTKYALLRRDFRHWKSGARPGNGRNVLVSMGGSDPGNVTAKILRAVNHCVGIEVRVVVGAGNTFLPELREIASKASSPMQLEIGASMPELMAWADVAISAAGSTLWELAYMGVPALTVEIAGHQRAIGRAFECAGAGVNLGPHKQLQDAKLLRELACVLQHDARRQAMSAQGRLLVDGRGTERVFNAMVQSR